MPLKLNSANGAITLTAEDGVGVANVTIPRGGFGTVSSLADLGVTASAAELNILDGATVTVTEVNYLSGVTSAIQTQIDGKASLTGATFTGAVSGTSLSLSGNMAGGIADATLNGDVKEKTTIAATATTGTINFDTITQQILFHTADATGNFTVNIRGDGSTTLDSIMAVGDSITLAFLVTNGGTAYYNSAVQVDGASVTPKWQGGSAPSSGNASSVDSYTYTVIKTAAATFTVLAGQTQFA